MDHSRDPHSPCKDDIATMAARASVSTCPTIRSPMIRRSGSTGHFTIMRFTHNDTPTPHEYIHHWVAAHMMPLLTPHAPALPDTPGAHDAPSRCPSHAWHRTAVVPLPTPHMDAIASRKARCRPSHSHSSAPRARCSRHRRRRRRRRRRNAPLLVRLDQRRGDCPLHLLERAVDTSAASVLEHRGREEAEEKRPA